MDSFTNALAARCTLQGRRSGMLLLAALVAFPSFAVGQAAAGFSLGVASGLGGTKGDTTYEGSVALGLRLSLGFRLTNRFGIESHAQISQGIGQGDQACTGGRPCPVPFDLIGAGVGLSVGVGPQASPSRFQLEMGFGLYRIVAENWVGREGRSTTEPASYAGASVSLGRWRFGALGVGVRGVLIPDAKGEAVWFVPIEARFRFP